MVVPMSAMVSAVVGHMMRSGLSVPLMNCAMMHWRGVVVCGASSARCREAGSSKRQAGENCSECLDGLVHITPSLSFVLFLFPFLLNASCAHIKQGGFDLIF